MANRTAMNPSKAPAMPKLAEFTNEPLIDFKDPGHRRAFQKALEKVRKELGRTYPIRIAGRDVILRKTFASINPARPDETVGVFHKGEAAVADRAVRAAADAFERWKAVPAQERARYCFEAARRMRERRHEFSAWMVFEVGKSWPEADADTAEAIDFLEFYGREAIRYGATQRLTPVPGERNALYYLPLGVGVVIAPWNFPLAILVGMTSASIVAGNTVVMKPAGDSATIAAKFAELMDEVGLPPGVLNFVTGGGAALGEPAAAHPLTRFVMFTGSKEVGLHLAEVTAKPGRMWMKRLVAEMGGKDAILVDDEADLDAAVEGVAASAFGFQGQKCSACSRAVVVESVYEEFCSKLAERVGRITVGPPEDPANHMGPVVNESSLRKIRQYVEIGRKEGKLLAGGRRIDRPGFFHEPTVFRDVPPTARISQEEIFGPVLAVTRAKDFDEALAFVNNTEYGLTGAIYSGNRGKIERARQEFHVGNLYINRKCTGALVGGHPFGGFNMSGTDSKAGGRDYLLLLTQAKVISEKI